MIGRMSGLPLKTVSCSGRTPLAMIVSLMIVANVGM